MPCCGRTARGHALVRAAFHRPRPHRPGGDGSPVEIRLGHSKRGFSVQGFFTGALNDGMFFSWRVNIQVQAVTVRVIWFRQLRMPARKICATGVTSANVVRTKQQYRI